MNTQKSKALRLAKELVSVHQGHADEGPSTFSESAAELRRLHSVNAQLLEALNRLLNSDNNIAEATEYELLVAVNDTESDQVVREQAAAVLQARSVIAKAQE